MKVRRIPEKTELYHHGIKGQQWGVQNGPPYPLDREKEYKIANKASKKLFNSTGKYEKKSKAVQSVINSEDIKNSADKVKSAENAIDDIESKNYKEIVNIAKPKLAKEMKTWAYDDDEIKDTLNDPEESWDILVDDIHVMGDWTGAFETYANKNSSYKKALEDYNNSYSDYKEKVKDYTEKIVGEYGDQKLASNQKYRDFVENTIEYGVGVWDKSNWHPAAKKIK